MRLSEVQCRNAAPREKAYKLTDGDGLYLEVRPNGAKYWFFQYRFVGKRPRLSFGVYPEVSLLEAREQRDQNRKLLRDGINPACERKREKLRQAISSANTFELLAREWHEQNLSQWSVRHASDVLLRFEKDVFPSIWTFPISDLTAPDILATIRKIAARGALELASRALQNHATLQPKATLPTWRVLALSTIKE